MKQIIRITVWGLLALSSGYIYLLAKTPIPSKLIIKADPLLDTKKAQKEALSYLNQLRIGTGLIPLQLNPHLNLAAKNHANYLIKNHRIGHHEDKNRAGFTGLYGSQRSIHSGYKTSMVIENISNNNFTHKESIDGLMAAIYHRFGFLDFHIDEIGIGVLQDPTKRAETAFVYDMGSQKLESLCDKKNQVKRGEYVENICADKTLKINPQLFNQTMQQVQQRNPQLITYPFDGQQDIPPAFYDEMPDPLPLHSVSGFPISISFNGATFKEIEMMKFQLFDQDNQPVEDVIIYNQQTDPNQRLKKFEFALFPLKRLEWESRYHVKALYKADGNIKNIGWTFNTQKFDTPIQEVKQTKQNFKIKQGKPIIFYFPPKSKVDTLGSLQYPASLDISFIDKNTIRLVADTPLNNRLILDIAGYTLSLEMEEEG
jgi:uncharacterized protein YkwD